MQARGMWSAGQGDDKDRFLADLRALRDQAALGYDELASRAHYPSDVLEEAEHGPSLPGLPVLAAYVRACDGDVPEWEERWRCLGFEAGAELGLPVRPAGASPAAVAGARAGIGVAPPDVYDPERIRAALRGRPGQTEQATARAGQQETAAADLASWGTAAWSTAATPSSTSDTANGNHHAGLRSAGLFDARVTRTPEAESPPGLREDPLPASWLPESDLAAPLPQDARLTSQDPASSELAWRPADGDVTQPEPADRGPAPQWERDGPAPVKADFWTPSTAAVPPADLHHAGPAAPPAEERPVPPSAWPPPAEPSASSPPDPAQRTVPELPRRSVPDPRQGAAPAADPLPQTPTTSAAPQTPTTSAAPQTPTTSAAPQTPTTSAAPQATSALARESRSDRLFPVRLLVVIVVAALIGSILVMLLR